MVCSADEEVADWEGGRQRGWMGDAIYAKDRLRLLGFLKVLRSGSRKRCRLWRHSNAYEWEAVWCRALEINRKLTQE